MAFAINVLIALRLSHVDAATTVADEQTTTLIAAAVALTVYYVSVSHAKFQSLDVSEPTDRRLQPNARVIRFPLNSLTTANANELTETIDGFLLVIAAVIFKWLYESK